MTQGEHHLNLWRMRFYGRRLSYVYVLQAPPATPIKIGRATSPYGRICELQTVCPYELKLLHLLPGDSWLEALLHRKLKGSRLHCEWFDGLEVPPFLEYVGGLAHKMVSAWKPGHKEPVSYLKLDPGLEPKPKKNEVTVSFVEPNPKVSKQEAQELRTAAILGYKPSRTDR